ncbi:MAG: hypothetical protein JWN50_744 [Parcubacteria group bacterium]|nr:hypothetical protein [Parcubacteria group bacterium]
MECNKEARVSTVETALPKLKTGELFFAADAENEEVVWMMLSPGAVTLSDSLRFQVVQVRGPAVGLVQGASRHDVVKKITSPVTIN